MAKYLAPVFKVAQPVMKPTIATDLAIVMCHVRSLCFPELMAHMMDMKPAIRYGGHVSTSVIVVLNPSVSTAVGKKFLKPFEARCMCCMKANSQIWYMLALSTPNHEHSFTFGSLAASSRPANVVVWCLAPTVSARIRACASSRSSGVSHRVVSGSSGKMKMAAMATAKVIAPCRIKSHCHPCSPWTSSRPLKIPAAIKPANAVARMLPV